MYSMWLSDEEQQVWRDYLRMVTGLQAAMTRQLQRDCELSLSDYDVLVVLSERGPLRIYQLAEELSWEQSRLSHQLRRMIGRGLVTRHGSDEDRRGATVELTADGRAEMELAAPGHAELVRSVMFDHLTPGELESVGAFVARVLHRLD